MKALDLLTTIRKFNEKDKNYVNRNLYGILYKEDIYVAAYENIKSKPCNVELDSFSTDQIQKIITQIKTEAYKFSPSTRIWIPKPGRIDKRPIDIGAVKDKIVLECIRIILEAVYEPTLAKEVHGFRINKSCHSALRDVRTQFRSTKWFIEGDLSKFFNSIDHEILIGKLARKIEDQRFLNLIRKSLNAGYYEFKIYKNDLIGVPQGNIISPILSNIYLQDFDEFILKLKEEFTIGTRRAPNSEYTELYNKVANLRRRRKPKTPEEFLELKTLHSSLLKIDSLNYKDPNYKRLNYIRYADDWLIGLIGSLEDAMTIKEKIKAFLKENLKINLNEDKTLITHSANEEALFLGTLIQCPIYKEQRFISKELKSGITVKQRIGCGHVTLKAPADRLINKLKNAGFCDGGGKSLPKFQWMQYEHGTILDLYNAVIRGIFNYYSFIDNVLVLARIYYILKSSAAKLLAAKYSLGTQAKVYKKFGNSLKFIDKVRGNKEHTLYARTSWKRSPMDFKVSSKDDVQTIIPALYARRVTRTRLFDDCVICGSTENIEMHHVKHLRKMGGNLSVKEKSMVSMNRKQIPVCKACHVDIHAGRYDGISLSTIIKSKTPRREVNLRIVETKSYINSLESRMR
jgi:group II intron reverse transcriptase/maturase